MNLSHLGLGVKWFLRPPRPLAIALSLLCAALAANAIRLVLDERGMSRAGSERTTPYTVVLQETFGFAASPQPGQRTVFAVRSDGSFARRRTTSPSQRQRAASVRMIGIQPHTLVLIDEVRELKSTIWEHDRRNWIRLGDPDAECMRTRDARPLFSRGARLEQTWESGHRVVKAVESTGTSWLALDLGCAVLRWRVVFADGSFSESRAMSVTAGEPDEEIFRVPDTTREVPPSVRTGTPSPSDDSYYYSHRNPATGSSPSR